MKCSGGKQKRATRSKGKKKKKASIRRSFAREKKGNGRERSKLTEGRGEEPSSYSLNEDVKVIVHDAREGRRKKQIPHKCGRKRGLNSSPLVESRKGW